MNIQTRAEGFHESSLTFKRHMWEDHGERQINPVMGVQYEGFDHLVDFYIESAMKMVEVFGLHKTFSEIIRDLASAIHEGKKDVIPEHFWPVLKQKALMALMSVEVYYTRNGNHLSASLDGPLAKRFASEPDTDVKQMLMTVLYEYNSVGEIEVAATGNDFHLTDGGQLEFGEEDILEGLQSPLLGNVDRVMREIFSLGREES